MALALLFIVALQAAAGTAAPAAAAPAQPAAAQAPDRAAAGAPAPSPQAPGASAPGAPPEGYSYDPAGRRDPFLNLLGTGNESRSSASRRGDGPGSLTAADISVRGIMQSRGTLIAMIKAPDNKTYIVHQGDKLLDGTIKTITPQGLVILQEVNDPLSLVKQREVSKLLRSLEVVKP
jgi:Tfp pilus assembly protein PilP